MSKHFLFFGIYCLKLTPLLNFSYLTYCEKLRGIIEFCVSLIHFIKESS